MSGKCRALGYITIILGIIGSFYLAYQFGNVVDFEFSGRVYYERDWTITLVYFVAGCFSSVLLGTIFTGMAEIMDKIDEVKKQQKSIAEMYDKKGNV